MSPKSQSAASWASIRRPSESTTARNSTPAQIKATAKVAEGLFRKATGDGSQSVTAAIFWLKTRGGWRETPQTHQVGHYDGTKLTDEELERMIGTLQVTIEDQTTRG